MRTCDHQWCSALTVNTSYALSREEALEAFRVDAKRLAQFIRRRFPDAIFVLEPEFDQKLVKDVQCDRYANANWKAGLDPQQQVYTVHFHGVIYVPGMKPEEVELAFERTANGKRSRHYGGASQVRALPMELEPETDIPDVENFLRYAEKCHFRPPVLERMLEGAAEWFWLTDKIQSDSSLIVLGGTRKPVQIYCSECKTKFAKHTACKCDSNITSKRVLINTDSNASCSKSYVISIYKFIQNLTIPNVLNISFSLNCPTLTPDTTTIKPTDKKYRRSFGPFAKLAAKVRKIFAPPRGP